MQQVYISLQHSSLVLNSIHIHLRPVHSSKCIAAPLFPVSTRPQLFVPVGLVWATLQSSTPSVAGTALVAVSATKFAPMEIISFNICFMAVAHHGLELVCLICSGGVKRCKVQLGGLTFSFAP